jgi:putative SOS response-associated peptidase YedK
MVVPVEERGAKAILDAINAPDNPNVAPTEKVSVIHISPFGNRIMTLMDWGFTVPDRPDVINARVETALEIPLFGKFVREQRCLIPAMGFYEWSGPKGAKQPWCFKLKEEKPFAFAGIWREYVGAKQFVILTTQANAVAAASHDRMPCMVSEEDYDLWLSGEAITAVGKIGIPYPADLMTCYQVTKAMGNSNYKVPDAHEPLRSLFDFE